MPLAPRIPSLLCSTTLVLLLAPGAARAGRPTTMETCKVCHAPADGVVRGKLVSVVPAMSSLSVTVGPLVWIVKYGKDLQVKEGARVRGPEALTGVPRDREIAVSFTGPETRPVAVKVAVKQPYRVPPDKLVGVEQVRDRVARDAPAAGKLLLFDSRPAPMFAEGHIPGAISLPYAAFKEKAAAVLPAERATPIAFYCAGET